MIKLFFLMILFFMGSYSLKAGETLGGDQDFKSELDNIKNPFEDGLSKPAVITSKPIYHYEKPKVVVLPRPRREFKPVLVEQSVMLPNNLELQGVMVGEDMHEAIISGQAVPLLGTIEGARVDSVSKEGVGLTFKGRKFFLKVD